MIIWTFPIPAHGGSDPGASGNNQFEKDFTLKISKYIYDRLNEMGIPVVLTRDQDITLSPAERTNRILEAFGDEPNVVVISNHLNAGGGTGAEVIYALRNSPTLAQSVLNNIGATGQKTRRIYQRRLPSDSSSDYYFIHRDTGATEPLIVEYGFIDDTPENNQFLNNHYKELAEAVIKAILEYKGIPYTAPNTSTGGSTYTVKAGDSLYKIAQKHNTTVDQLKTLNHLTNNNLAIGQILALPVSTRNTYTVKSGDTLYSIASRNNTTVQLLKDLNRLNNNNLSIGQVLILPATELLEIPSTNTTYTVQSGDTLYSIAKKYDTTVEQIKRLNQLTSNSLIVGQILKIPTTSSVEIPTTTKNYTVKPGDTLYSIAKDFNTTVNNIKNLNHLSNNMISVGQNLLLS